MKKDVLEALDLKMPVINIGKDYPGFVLSNTGGFNGNIPIENIKAYINTANTCAIR